MTFTYQCSGCLRVFVLPMLKDTDERMGQAPKSHEYQLTCVCGTVNHFPLMWVSPFPLKSEVPA